MMIFCFVFGYSKHKKMASSVYIFYDIIYQEEKEKAKAGSLSEYNLSNNFARFEI